MRIDDRGRLSPGRGVLLAACVLAALVVSRGGLAADTGQPGRVLKHKPFLILSNSGNGGGSIPTNTATALDNPTTVNCAKANGCTIFIGSTVSLFQSTNAVHWQVCAIVDGSNASPNCPIQDTNVGNIVGSWRQNFTVAQGTHTVQTFITQTGTAQLGSWEVDYTVATP